MPTTCLVTYDITSPRRLRRMHRALKKMALPIQYSVFLGQFTNSGLARLRACIADIVDPAADDVRIYPLPHGCWQRRIGRPNLPRGVLLTMLPAAFRTPADPRSETAETAPPAAATPPAAVRGRAARYHVRRAPTGQRQGIHIIR